MKITPTEIADVLLIKPDVYRDERGFFMETYRRTWYHELGANVEFVQDNLSCSQQNTLRGLHYQIQNRQAKLLMVPRGKILDVAVDLRVGSPTFGQHVATELSSENKYQLFIPEGFAHGFSVLSDEVLVYYKCSDYYNPDAERGVRWDDPELDIDWKVSDPIISEKDRHLPLLKDIAKEDLF